MADFKRMYTCLFSAVTVALDELHSGSLIDAEYTLKKAQAMCEEIFIESEADINIAERVKIIPLSKN